MAAGGSWTESILYNFTIVNGDGNTTDTHGVLLSSDGSLYGTTLYGGRSKGAKVCTNGCGTVFHALTGVPGGGRGRNPISTASLARAMEALQVPQF